MKRLLLAVVVLAGCVRPSHNLDDSLSPVVRDGGTDAGATLDAGAEPDAGELDAGPTPDAGMPFDAGACVIDWLATPTELAASPRANLPVEYVALEGSETDFVVSDATYARALAEWTTIVTLMPDAGILPRNASGLIFTLDDAGVAQLTTGQFHEWDCLNWAYRGTPRAIGQWGFVEFAPVVNVDLLAPLYLSLPHITAYEPNLFGVIDFTPDTCVQRDDDGGDMALARLHPQLDRRRVLPDDDRTRRRRDLRAVAARRGAAVALAPRERLLQAAAVGRRGPRAA